MSNAFSSLQKAQMREGDFHLRSDSRQMFGNYVILSELAGTPGPLEKFRRSAMFVATPVYDAPKLWWLDVEFETIPNLSSPAQALSPWLPTAVGAGQCRITVMQALDRDKQTAVRTFDLGGLNTAPNVRSTLEEHVFAGHQISVKVEMLATGLGGAPIGTQVSLVEVTNDERDCYRDSVITRFAQSNASQTFLQPNRRRRQFFVTNNGTTPLYVSFSFFAVGPGAGAFYTFQLPQKGDVYESPRDCWQGHVSGIWLANAGTVNDQALVTEGF